MLGLEGPSNGAYEEVERHKIRVPSRRPCRACSRMASKTFRKEGPHETGSCLTTCSHKPTLKTTTSAFVRLETNFNTGLLATASFQSSHGKYSRRGGPVSLPVLAFSITKLFGAQPS